SAADRNVHAGIVGLLTRRSDGRISRQSTTGRTAAGKGFAGLGAGCNGDRFCPRRFGRKSADVAARPGGRILFIPEVRCAKSEAQVPKQSRTGKGNKAASGKVRSSEGHASILAGHTETMEGRP